MKLAVLALVAAAAAVVVVLAVVLVVVNARRGSDAYAAAPAEPLSLSAPPPAEPLAPPLSPAAARARGALEHLEYRQRTCANLRRMYEPVLAAGTCDADVSANLPPDMPSAARPSVAVALAARCREFPSVRDLSDAIDECRD